jgi:hypothetical protein
MEIDLEDKWWLQLEEDHSLSPSEKGEEANSLPGKSCTKRRWNPSFPSLYERRVFYYPTLLIRWDGHPTP